MPKQHCLKGGGSQLWGWLMFQKLPSLLWGSCSPPDILSAPGLSYFGLGFLSRPGVRGWGGDGNIPRHQAHSSILAFPHKTGQECGVTRKRGRGAGDKASLHQPCRAPAPSPPPHTVSSHLHAFPKEGKLHTNCCCPQPCALWSRGCLHTGAGLACVLEYTD